MKIFHSKIKFSKDYSLIFYENTSFIFTTFLLFILRLGRIEAKKDLVEV